MATTINNNVLVVGAGDHSQLLRDVLVPNVMEPRIKFLHNLLQTPEHKQQLHITLKIQQVLQLIDALELLVKAAVQPAAVQPAAVQPAAVQQPAAAVVIDTAV